MDYISVPTKSTFHNEQGITTGHVPTNIRMQWFILIILALCLLVSVAFGVAALIITHNIVTLAIPGPLLFAMRPVIRYLFPQNNK